MMCTPVIGSQSSSLFPSVSGCFSEDRCMSHKKPPERRQHHGKAGPVAVVRTHGKPARPPAPLARGRGWLATTSRAWDAFLASGPAQLTLPVDELALQRLFALYDARTRVWSRFLRRPTAAGSAGQDVVNPMGAFALQLDTRIAQAEKAFGITPKARAALGITFAEATRSLEDLAREAAHRVKDA